MIRELRPSGAKWKSVKRRENPPLRNDQALDVCGVNCFYLRPARSAIVFAGPTTNSRLSSFSALTQSSISFPGPLPRRTYRSYARCAISSLANSLCSINGNLLGCRCGERTSAPPHVSCVELLAVCCGADFDLLRLGLFTLGHMQGQDPVSIVRPNVFRVDCVWQ